MKHSRSIDFSSFSSQRSQGQELYITDPPFNWDNTPFGGRLKFQSLRMHNDGISRRVHGDASANRNFIRRPEMHRVSGVQDASFTQLIKKHITLRC